ncbi:hypothetical protein BCV69DRAFT_283215, partial [Microstroma glucosiphilum]
MSSSRGLTDCLGLLDTLQRDRSRIGGEERDEGKAGEEDIQSGVSVGKGFQVVGRAWRRGLDKILVSGTYLTYLHHRLSSPHLFDFPPPTTSLRPLPRPRLLGPFAAPRLALRGSALKLSPSLQPEITPNRALIPTSDCSATRSVDHFRSHCSDLFVKPLSAASTPQISLANPSAAQDGLAASLTGGQASRGCEPRRR